MKLTARLPPRLLSAKEMPWGSVWVWGAGTQFVSRGRLGELDPTQRTR